MDTDRKRASAVNLGCPWRGILPFPDASIAEEDWPVPAFMYSGIQADFPVPQPLLEALNRIGLTLGLRLGL